MLETSEMTKKIAAILEDDALFAVIRDTPLEEILYTDAYLTEIIEKKFYSTPEVARWFEITDAQLRYYIKPFEQYLFDDLTMNPTTATVIRLNLPAILKLRMILLLKNEYRMKGLKRLLDIHENGHIIKKQIAATTTVTAPDELANKVEMLNSILQQMMHTGLFHMKQDDETGAIEIEVNEDYFTQSIQLLTTASNEQISDIQNRIEQLTEENKQLQKQMTEINETSIKDLAVKIRERQLEKDVISTLHAEAVEQFSNQKKTGIFAKLFRSAQIELEKERFINAYLAEHLPVRLEKTMEDYHDI
jgi:DNA-binding transcriptional MerR regulator